MSTPLTALRFHSTLADGSDNAGGKLYCYAAGTTTPQATYTTSARNVANANPVILDSTGRASVYLDPALAYKFVLTDADGVSTPDGVVDNWSNELATDLGDVSTAAKGDALIGWGAVTSIVDGVLTRHATIAAAITAVGSTRADILVRDDVTVSADATIPAACTLRVDNRAILTLATGVTLTINGRFHCSESKCFAGAGKVLLGKDSVRHILPQWWGAKGDAAIDGTSGTDCDAAFAAACAAACEDGISDVAIHPLLIGPGNFLVGTGLAALPVATNLVGLGRHQSCFVTKPGATGVVIGDAGNAAKIMLSGFSLYNHSEAAVTYGIRLGYGAQQHGTEGYVRDVWVRDVDGASAVWGIDINGNVSRCTGLVAQDCKSGIRVVGVANEMSEVVVYAPTVTGCEVNLCNVRGIEIEAPGDSCVPLKISGNASVDGLVIALSNGTTIPHLGELGADAATWQIRQFCLAFGNTPAGITVSNGNFKRSDGSYFGGNATAGSRAGEGHYTSETAGQKPQCFAITILNNAGTLQHKITDPTVTGAGAFYDRVSGASATYTNTPTGTDSSTAMATGGKIGSATQSVFWLNTAAQVPSIALNDARIQACSAGTALSVQPLFLSININGVTRTRLGLQFFNLATGAAFDLTTANIASTKIVQVVFNGNLS